MQPFANELLLALRSPRSGWLATMVCALEEALKDPDFSEHHRTLVGQLLEHGTVAATVANAADERMTRFEHSVAEAQAGLTQSIAAATAATRPKLTLVSNAA